MEKHIDQYYEILEKYRKGAFGQDHLSVGEGIFFDDTANNRYKVA